jgi:hypothetical protein
VQRTVLPIAVRQSLPCTIAVVFIETMSLLSIIELEQRVFMFYLHVQVFGISCKATIIYHHYVVVLVRIGVWY